MTSRLVRGIGANLVAQGVTAATQVAAVPVLVRAWGQDDLGTWLTLVAWTSLLSMADCGIMAAAGNAMLMRAGRGDRVGIADLFGWVLGFVTAVAAALGGAVCLGAALLPTGLAGAGHGAAAAPRAAVALLGCAALSSLPLGVLELGFRAGGHYPAGVLWMSAIRLAETSACLVVAWSGGGLAGAALAWLATRLAGTLLAGLRLRAAFSWLFRHSPGPRAEVLRGLVRPALAILAIPAAFALSLQGTTIAAGSGLGAGAVALFVAARTLTRALVQALGLVTHAVMPELAQAAGAQDSRRTAALLRLNVWAALGLLVPGWLALVGFGPALMARWTLGALVPDPVFFGLTATAALIHGSWLSAANLRLALNRQGEYAYAFLLTAAATVCTTAVAARLGGLDGVAAACTAGEAVMAGLVLPGYLREAFGGPKVLRPVSST